MSQIVHVSIICYDSTHSCVSEASGTTLGDVQLVDALPLYMRVPRHNHLGDTVTIVDGKRLVGKIDHYHSDFATVICIDSARSIDKRYAVLQS